MPRACKAIIFDFDGLILDTEVPEYEAWSSVYRAHGVELELSVWVPHIGRGIEGFDVYHHLETLVSRPIHRGEARRRHRTIFDGMLDGAGPMPGVEDYIASARDLEIRLGIASSSTRSWVIPKLEHIGLANAFDTIVCADDVGSSKPDPASYLTALGNLGVTAEQALALEDSPTGVLGAKNAGLTCIAVPGVMTRDLSFPRADFRLESLADMPLADLLEAVL